jgi:hypothetical protein
MINKNIILGFVDFLVIIMVILIAVKSVLALNSAINIPQNNLEVVAGGQLNFELQIKYPENANHQNLYFIYQIKKGDQVLSETNTFRSIEIPSSFTDHLIVPGSLEIGTYTLTGKIQGDTNPNDEISTNFRVVKSQSDLLKYIYVLGLTVIITGFLFFIDFFKILRVKKNNYEK